MLSINIEYAKMNTTQSTVSDHKPVNDTSEFYLLIIMVKLSILTIAKISQALVHLYKMHNKKVIKTHNNMTMARLREITTRVNDCESGLSNPKLQS